MELSRIERPGTSRRTVPPSDDGGSATHSGGTFRRIRNRRRTENQSRVRILNQHDGAQALLLPFGFGRKIHGLIELAAGGGAQRPQLPDHGAVFKSTSTVLTAMDIGG